MLTLKDIVEQRLEQLGVGAVEAATRAGMERTFIRDIVEGRKKSVRADKLSSLAAALSLDTAALSRGELVAIPGSVQDTAGAPASPAPSKPNASFPPRWEDFPQGASIPTYGQVIGGPNGRFVLNGQEVGRVFRPPMLIGVDGAYSVRVYGTSMEPRYFAGETIWLNPHEPVRAGDFVVVQLAGEDEDENYRESYIKQFVSRSSSVLRLKQLNPDEGESDLLELPNDRVLAIHKIVFQASL